MYKKKLKEVEVNEWGLTEDEVKYLEETGQRWLAHALVAKIALGEKRAVEIFNRIKENMLKISREYVEANIQKRFC